MSAQQSRAARAVLDMSLRDLALRSGVSESTVRRIESNGATLDTRARVMAYFEAQGVRFDVKGRREGLSWPA